MEFTISYYFKAMCVEDDDTVKKSENILETGTEVKITVPTLEKEYTGYIVNVSSTASNGRFKVTSEFEND